mgnify:CR=1 FL=1
MKTEKIFIGIDLAWTYNNETGICFINQNGEITLLKSEVFDDSEIINIIQDIENIDEKQNSKLGCVKSVEDIIK